MKSLINLLELYFFYIYKGDVIKEHIIIHSSESIKKNKITVVMIGCPLIAVSFNILVDQPITGQQKA
jgi:hypothetical protein